MWFEEKTFKAHLKPTGIILLQREALRYLNFHNYDDFSTDALMLELKFIKFWYNIFYIYVIFSLHMVFSQMLWKLPKLFFVLETLWNFTLIDKFQYFYAVKNLGSTNVQPINEVFRRFWYIVRFPVILEYYKIMLHCF